MGTKIAIQINSLEALEKLLGTVDGEITIELKQAVVQEFTKKHLKAIATEDIIKKATEATKEWIDEHYFDIVKDKSIWQGEKRVFKESTMSMLKEMLSRVGNASIKHWAEELFGIDKMKEKVQAALENASLTITTALTDSHLEGRLKLMVDQKINKMSELASKLK